ncbi:fluoride efflux transporter FluC [Aeromicrobium stalagmiti]|uniref:fluoride efflux transporter FluC n=1 Tax=Aeromicrobium stalagmiti TaxID=2738988 RepID=UPI001C2C72CF
MSTFDDQPVDPDVESSDRVIDRGRAGHRLRAVTSVLCERWDILGVIAAGGAAGAIGRGALLDAFPHRLGELPWATVAINASGSLLLGVLMVVVVDVLPDQRLLRPFLGVGVLGGYTTFSTAALDVHELLRTGHVAVAAAYLVLSVSLSLLAVWSGLAGARSVVRRVHRVAS